MKNGLLIAVFVVFVAASFTSCKKSYVCDCTQITDKDYGKLKKDGVAYLYYQDECERSAKYSDSTCTFISK
jgi:hypothetical protein